MCAPPTSVVYCQVRGDGSKGGQQRELPSEPWGSQLLITKLRPPKLGSAIVPRRRLRERLREGLAGPLTLVTAPAGYGKTTALVAVLTEYTGAWGWLSLDEHDNDLPTFVVYFIAAIRKSFPDAGRSTLSLLRQSRLPSIDFLARTLANELAALPYGSVLALDEFDVIQNPLIIAFLDALLCHSAAGLHLAIATRQRPDLALGRLRTRDLLTEIDARLLRFTREETQTFLERALSVAIPAEIVTAVDERIEGWPAGLRLFALSAGVIDDPLRVTDVLADEFLSMADAFVWEEVLTRQSDSTQAFLARTALFDRLCLPLVDAAVAPQLDTNARDLLVRLAQASMFVTAVDEDKHGTWYRYHSLVRAALRHRLRESIDVADYAALHLRASAWFAEHNFIEEAMDHALQAGTTEAAVDLVEAHAAAEFNREEWSRVERWLARLPPDVVKSRPGLLIARAWIAHLRGQIGAIPGPLAAAKRLLDALPSDARQARADRAQIETLHGVALVLAGKARPGLAAVQSGWERLPVEHVYARRVAISYWAIAAQALGEGETTHLMLQAESADFVDDPVYAEGVAFGLAYHHLAEGTLDPAHEIMTSLLQTAQPRDFPLSIAWANFLLGRLCYEWDDLPAAEAHFRAVLDRRDEANFLPLQGSVHGLALALAAQGELRSAHRHIEMFTDMALQTWSPTHLRTLRSLRARLALREADLATALRWMSADAPPPFIPVFAVEDSTVTRAWTLLMAGGQTSLDAAAISLTRLGDAYAAWHDTLHLVPALALHALVLCAQGKQDLALEVLARAVRLGAPGRMTRSFLDFGTPMARLIDELAARQGKSEHLIRLQLAFNQKQITERPNDSGWFSKLVEPLTPREMEVLNLLRQRLSNREITEALHISLETVHTHTRNIYQKLHVERRQDAVAAALRLGWLPDE
jgi:LuxR family transcriptional regulator, maltose regulon positive regulatory protein